jgi:hypothetical protein
MANFVKIAAVTALLSFSAMAQPPAGVPAKPPAQTHRHKAKAAPAKETPPPRPTPIPQMTPEQLPAQPPQVSYRNGELNVVSQNATLGDVLNAIRQQTGAQIDPVPGASNERVAVRLSGTPRAVISSLLDGSKYGYIIVGAPGDPGGVQKVMLTTNAAPATGGPQTASAKPAQPAWTPPPDYSPDANGGVDEEPTDNTADRNALPPDAQPPQMPPQPPAQLPQQGPPGSPQAGQPSDQSQNPYTGGQQNRFGQPAQIPPNPPTTQQNPDQPQIKTPDQLLQELQRLRQQQQQRQNPPQ